MAIAESGTMSDEPSTLRYQDVVLILSVLKESRFASAAEFKVGDLNVLVTREPERPGVNFQHASEAPVTGHRSE